MKLPYNYKIKQEQIIEKLATCALNFEHKDGQHKARLFKSKLGITISNNYPRLTSIYPI